MGFLNPVNVIFGGLGFCLGFCLGGACAHGGEDNSRAVGCLLLAGIIGLPLFFFSVAMSDEIVPILGILFAIATACWGAKIGYKVTWAEYERLREEREVEKIAQETGVHVKGKRICPWCGDTVRAVVETHNLLRRDACSCPKCHNKILVCRMCDKRYAKGGFFWDDELCDKCSL